MLIIPRGIVGPSAITITFRAVYFGFDLSDVSTVLLRVRRKDGTSTVWAAAIVAQNSAELIAQYVFTDTGEITSTGAYYISPELVVPGGAVLAGAITMVVTPDDQLTPQLEASAFLGTTSAIAGTPIRQTWNVVDGANTPYAAFALSPWVAFDLRTDDVVAQLWTAVDGDIVVLSNPYDGGHAATLNAAAGQVFLPSGDDTLVIASFPLHLKYSEALSGWVEW